MSPVFNNVKSPAVDYFVWLGLIFGLWIASPLVGNTAIFGDKWYYFQLLALLTSHFSPTP